MLLILLGEPELLLRYLSIDLRWNKPLYPPPLSLRSGVLRKLQESGVLDLDSEFDSLDLILLRWRRCARALI